MMTNYINDVTANELAKKGWKWISKSQKKILLMHYLTYSLLR